MNPRIMYYAKFLSFHLSVLNSDDEVVRTTARHSLELHLSKRKINQTQERSGSFAGYELDDNGNLKKHSKVNWTKSVWCHLHAMCRRENISVQREGNMFFYSISLDENLTVKVENSHAFYSVYKQRQLQRLEKDLTDKISQGRIIREVNTHVDFRLSNSFLSNHKLSDSLLSFICRGRLQLLQCDSLLHIYYPETYTKSCKICRNPSDTASHILNGCTQFKGLYQERHNRIVNLIFTKVAARGKEVLKDTVLRPALFDGYSESFRHKHTRPDIVVVDRDLRKVIIIEVAIPFDAHIPKCYQGKFEKYFPLALEINQLGFYSEVIVLVVGSLGSVHTKFMSGLQRVGINKTEAKFLAKYCSISAVIGSHRVWRRRCGHYIYRR